MPGPNDHAAGASSRLPATPRETPPPESLPRDTQPTGVPPHSTLPPEEFATTPAASTALSLPTSEIRSTASDTEHSTLHSAPQPGSGSASHWDERRILHLEHELDQLSARHRLQDKRIDELYGRLRWLLGLGLLLALLVGLWLATSV